MLIVRPIQHEDKEAILGFAKAAGVGHTNLPDNERELQAKIDHSELSFNTHLDQAGEESYQFVLENTGTQELAGTCAIDACVGLSEPNYSYRLSTLVHASKDLKMVNRVLALHLSHDYTGVSRLSAFYLHPDYRHSFYDQLLSKARLMFMACFPERFSGTTIAEIKGVLNAKDSSPFWDSLGRHFFAMDFAEADSLSGTSNKSFIADLMPRHPVYVPLLPAAAQEVIGQHNEDFEDIVNILEHEGLQFMDQVDIFDAGPILEARTRLIRTIRQVQQAEVVLKEDTARDNATPSVKALLSNNRYQEFRCVLGNLSTDGKVYLTAEEAKALALLPNQHILVAPL